MKRLIGWSNTGLGDRIVAMSRTLDIARMSGVYPAFLWEYNTNLYCDFDALFDNRDIKVIYKTPPGTMVVDENKVIAPYLWDSTENVAVKTYHHITDPIHKIDKNDPFGHIDLSNILVNHKLMALAEIDGYKLDVGNRVGVHVRRGDLVQNKHFTKAFLHDRLLPESTFFDHIDKHYPDSPLFLATESKQVEKRFRAHYGQRVVMRPKKSYVRIIQQGIVDAMVDMLLLAQCNKMIGPHSMFTICASKLGGTELERIVSSSDV